MSRTLLAAVAAFLLLSLPAQAQDPGFTKLTWILQAVDQTRPDWRQLDLKRDGTALATWNGYQINGRASADELAKIDRALEAAKLGEVDGRTLLEGAGDATPYFQLTASVGGHDLKVKGRYSEDPSITRRLQLVRNAVEDVLYRIVQAPHELRGTVRVEGADVVLMPFEQTRFVVQDGTLRALLKPLAGRRVQARVVPVSLGDFSFKGGPVKLLGVYGTNESAKNVPVRGSAKGHEIAAIANGMSVLVTGASGKDLEIDAEGVAAKGFVAKGALDLGLPDAKHAIAKPAKPAAKPARTTGGTTDPQIDPFVKGIARALAASGGLP